MINSKSNEQVKLLVSLKSKKYREKYSKYIIEGIKLVGEMINSGGIKPTEFIVYSEAMLKSSNGGEKLYNIMLNSDIKLVEVTEEIFKYISDTETPQGVLVVKECNKYNIDDILKTIYDYADASKKFLILDKVSDAGNLGTIIRSAVSFAVDCIICIKGTVELYSPKVVRSTMGAIEKLKIFYVDEDECKQIAEKLIQSGYRVVSTSLKATNTLKDIDYSKKVAFVMGNEANGVSDVIGALCTDFVKIQMEDSQESLNVAVATSICLYSQYINE